MLNMKQKAELAATFMQPDNQPQMKRIHLSPRRRWQWQQQRPSHHHQAPTDSPIHSDKWKDS